MIRYYAKHSLSEDFQIITQPRGTGVWAHGEEVTAADIESITRHYSLNPNIVRDIQDADELPRVEYSDGALYVFLRVPRFTKRGEVMTSPFLSVTHKDMYITLARDTASTPQKIIDANLPIRTSDTKALLLATLAAIIDEYEMLIRHTARSIKDVQHRLRSHEVGNRDFIRFVTIEDNLNEYRMNLDGMHAITERLRENRYDIFTVSDLEAIDDAALHIQQLIVSTRSHGQSVTSIRNAYSTVANITLNQRMKLLTMLTVLVALPNVFYGMYGMNVALPFADEPWAYAAIVTFTFLLILFAYLLVRRFKVF